MKKKGKLLANVLSATLMMGSIIAPGSMVFADTDVAIDATNFPDQNFRNVVISCDLDGSGSLSQAELEGVTSLYLYQLDISSVKGIEYFTKLTSLFCNENKLTELDLSNNPDIEYLSCEDNQLKSLDLSHNLALKGLTCNNNQIESLELGGNKKFVTIICGNNKISKLDVKDCTDLEELKCAYNNITSLDLSNCPRIMFVECEYNKLTTLEMGKNEFLEYMTCHNNELTTLDVSGTKVLSRLYCSDNKLTSLKFNDSNEIDTLMCSNNMLTSFSVNNTMRSVELMNNQLASIDLKNADSLQFLNCNSNKLTSIDISNLKSLVDLMCADNLLTNIDISKTPSLYSLNCANNQLTSIDVSKNPDLGGLVVSSNKLTSLDVSKNSNLGGLFCDNNKITGLDLSNNPYLTNLVTFNNPIATLDVSKTNLANPDWAHSTSPLSGVMSEKVVCVEAEKSISFSDDVKTMFPTDEEFKDFYDTGNISTLKLDENTEALYYFYIFAVDKATVVTGTSFEVPKFDIPQAPAANGTVDGFAERLYTTCLGRESEAEGKEYWSSVLKSGMTGAEVAAGFFFSPEVEAKNLSNEDYIKSLYETFMGRTPADEEVAYWVSEMNKGQDKKAVFDGFVNSTEWADICLDYGIRSGGLGQPTHVKQPSVEVKSFAERLYTSCLGRNSEEAGLAYWASALANLQQSGTEAARGFFFSPEFINLNLSNEDFVTRLYGTFMGREPDKAGFEYWVGQLNAGESRESVFNNFTSAPEFADICANAGIMR